MTAQTMLHPKITTEMENNTGALLEVEHESKMALIRRLEHLERLVFGQPMAHSTYRRGRENSLGERVAAIAKDVATAEGGDNCHMMKLVDQASDLGIWPLLPLGPSTATPPTFAESSNMAVMESILLGSREEIESTARALAQVKSLEQYVNPPFLRDMSQMSDILSRLQGNYLQQAAEVAHITERTEETRLHYGQAISLVSEKFVHWDDQVSRSECERDGGGTSAT